MSEQRDIVDRLREIRERPFKESDRLYATKAADEIVNLRAQLDTVCKIQRESSARQNAAVSRAEAAEAQLASARKALKEIANHPMSKAPTKADESSYGVGWAFWNVQHIAKAALRA